MTKVDVYNSDYTSLNHAYIQIFESYKKLLDVSDADPEVMDILGKILMVFNPTLDKIKSEMTVKTRYKEVNVEEGKEENKKKSGGPIILHGDFSGE